MTALFHDLRIAVRHLLKAPGFTATAVLMLAFGIGATTAIFSIVEGVLLRPLPFAEPNRIMVLSDIIDGLHVSASNEVGVTAPDTVEFVRDIQTFSSLGAYRSTPYELSGSGDPAIVSAARLTGGIFPTLAVQPILGRFFTQQEDDQSQPVAVLSYATWTSRFHADPGVIGRKILLDRKPYLVIGVMPRTFEFPLSPGHLNRAELWVPMSFSAADIKNGMGNWSYQMIGRLKPGVTSTQANNDATRVAAEIMRGYPPMMSTFHIHTAVRPLQEEAIEEARPLIRTLFLAVAVVLLIACANLAGLLLVRAIRRRREMAVRLALGATAATLLRQAMLESLVISVTGGVVGLALAATALRVGVGFLPESLPRVGAIALDWQVVAFALGLAVLTGILCGLAPAFAAANTSLNDTLKEGGRTGTSGGSHARLRSALVVAEIAVAMVLLAASGLLLRSFERMRQVDLGFHPDHTLTASYSLPDKQYATEASVNTFIQDLERRVQALPGVTAMGITTALPASGGGGNQSFIPEGYVHPKDADMDLATHIQVDGDYFHAMGIPLLQGRYLTQDDNANTQLVIVVNHRLAQHYWPDQDPVGKRIRVGTTALHTPWLTIVGVVADAKDGKPDEPTRQQFYAPLAQSEKAAGELSGPGDKFGDSSSIAIRTSMPPEQMENALRAAVREIDPQLPLDQVQTMEHVVAASEAPRSFNTALISAFAAAAVLLAILGIYSVIAFSVALRMQEIAIRMALGSQRIGIVRLILTSGAKLAVIGCAIGLVGALFASRLLGSLLFEVSAFDPLVLTAATLSVLLLALGATFLPARRAAAIDPIITLRAE